ncbi:MAG: DNA polymerase subunit beta, partial [Clostridia bacterium]|nr:DNA polymerase subunit beta [Clostridia bacterium]
PDTVVYWGTSGEQITYYYNCDSFCKINLPDDGILLYGDDIRGQIRRPTFEELRADIQRHYETVRKYGGKPEKVCIPSAGCWISPAVSIRYAPGRSLQKRKPANGRWRTGFAPM